jgi:hypothetical protein
MSHLTWRSGVVLAALLISLSAAVAQDASDFVGTVTLRSGQAYTGVIKLAELGVVLGSGVGNLRDEYGLVKLKTGDQEVAITGRDIKSIDADWVNEGGEALAKWVLKSLTVTRKDGSTVTGQPTWPFHCSTLSIVLGNGELTRVSAYPLGSRDFTPDNLIKSITIGKTEPAAPVAPVTPAPEKPAEPVTPAPEKPAEPTAPVTPAPEKPAEPAAPVTPAPEKPAEPVAPAPEKPAEPTAPVTPAPEKPAEPAAPVTPAPEKPAEPVTPAPEKPAEPTAPVTPAPEKPAEPAAPVTPAPEKPAEPVAPAIPPVPVKCVLGFANIGDAAEIERIKGVIAPLAVDNAVAVEAAADGFSAMTFTLADVSAYPALVEALKYKTAADGTKTLVFEESGRQISSAFRTVAIRGQVKMTVTFSVTPGAKLFYSPAAGQETEVPADQIAADGKVTMDVSIARGQEAVYGRTVLGEVEKCIKIDIYSGDVMQIARAEYDAHK